MSLLYFLFATIVILLSSFSESYHLQKCFSQSIKLYAYNEEGKVATNSALGNLVSVYESVESVQDAICNDFIISAQNAISRHDRFYCAVPGGSVLKMLSGLKKIHEDKGFLDWNKIHMFYVNHKCVPVDDASSTHFKAQSIFLDFCPINAYKMSESSGGASGHDTDADMYKVQIEGILPVKDGLPIFDYMLLGMGKDGHIGSLYPERKEVLMTDKHTWVLSVDKKNPPSISLSLPVMNAAREVRVVLTGADKAKVNTLVYVCI